jgi:hypothetical protein
MAAGNAMKPVMGKRVTTVLTGIAPPAARSGGAPDGLAPVG